MAGAGGAVAFDYFVGSGTSFLAAPADMTVVGTELDPTTCGNAVARFQAATGIAAERLY